MIISIPKILTDKLGNDGADALVHVLNDAETSTKSNLATKADLSEMKAELLKWMVLFWVTQLSAFLFALLKQ